MQQHKQPSALWLTNAGSANKIFADLSIPESASIPEVCANET